MAEKIVSPGVFTRERDLSFLPQGISEIGAAIVGPFAKGPAFLPTIVETQTDFERIFGTPDGTYYTSYAVQSYLREAGTCTVVRVGHLGGYTQTNAALISITGSNGNYIVGTLHNSKQNGSSLGGFSGSVLTQAGTTENFLIASGSHWTYSGSLSTGSANYIDKVFGTDPLGSRDAYVFKQFKALLGRDFNSGSGYTVAIEEFKAQTFSDDITFASTPWIRSQLLGNERFDLLRFHTLGDGNAANVTVKVAIENIKAAGSIQGSDFGTFNVVVRSYGDTDARLQVLETFQGLTLDPTSPNYVARVIGDRSVTISSAGKITESGNWRNNSNYIRVEVKDFGEYPVQAVPAALAEHTNPIDATDDTLIPPVVFTVESATDTDVYSGVDFDWVDNKQYNAPLPTEATGSNGIFCLDSLGTGESGTAVGLDLTLTTTSEVAKRKFIFGFQGGFDGTAPNIPINIETDITSTNSQGMNLSNSTASGSVAYTRALNAISNADEWDINLVVTPGVIRRLHSSVTTKAIDVCEDRGDCFYIADFNAQSDTITQAVTQADAVDSNYASTWYPWVKIVDTNTNQLIAVPPSVVLPRIFAANDKVAAEWFAPAGLNRGGIVDAVQVVNRLTHTERDDLYESNVNPIAAFPGQGIAVWGQKTLQKRPSALDRINVRRLLIGLKKFIASTSRYLVFEQNVAQTRTRFLNIVNPYLEQVQQRQGLYAFRVVMDESNNTDDIIDRNILYGQIFVQPAKTAEFIVVDFNVLPTGASFDQ